MNTARFTLNALVIEVLSLFTVTSVHGQSLTLTQPFKHDGLTFSEPLNFDHSSSLIKPITLEFGTIDEIDVQPTTKQQIAVELIVTPTPTPDKDVVRPDSSTSTLTPFPSPTSLPSPLPTATPTPQTHVVTLPSNPSGLNADILFQMVNDYRASKGLPTFQKDEKSCSLAASRAPEVEQEVASGTMHSGLRARNLPYWNTENIISMRNETEAFNWWINDQIHKEAIESNNTYSCMSCSGNSCAEEFTNYQPK